jgi:2-amino-4-hydroxy-6-hydroxymethyldihydropteridine diphosphokinase
LTTGYLNKMNKAYLLLGGNTGNRLKNIDKARQNINGNAGTIIRTSACYETEAWGNTNQASFLNQVVVIQTTLDAPALMKAILQIEKKMGRTRTVKNAPRNIDIDILFFNKEQHHTTDLVIPHPQIQNRRFVLTPLNELAPGLVHPLLNKTIHQLLINCPDMLDVKKF